MLTRLAVILCALNLALFVQAAATEPAADTAALEAASKLHVARNGDEVMVSWELPQASIKGLDIYRNTQERTAGRGRLDFVRPQPAVYIDKVPVPKASYWYWIKVVFNDGRVINVGPVVTPSADVWTP